MSRLRATVIGGAGGGLAEILAIQFPVSGTLSGDTNLGIAWANPLDHTQLLSEAQGFTPNCGWLSINLWTCVSSTLAAGDGSYALKLFMVDGSGADMYQLSSNNSDMQAALANYDALSFGLSGQTIGNGIRGQFTGVTLPGAAASIVIPPIIYFFGDTSVS